jgi:hypothetical protein
MKKLERKEIAVLVITVLVLVTVNSWWRVKETGRRARIAAMKEAALQDAGTEAE